MGLERERPCIQKLIHDSGRSYFRRNGLPSQPLHPSATLGAARSRGNTAIQFPHLQPAAEPRHDPAGQFVAQPRCQRESLPVHELFQRFAWPSVRGNPSRMKPPPQCRHALRSRTISHTVKSGTSLPRRMHPERPAWPDSAHSRVGSRRRAEHAPLKDDTRIA
jgi:hypothetical protein